MNRLLLISVAFCIVLTTSGCIDEKTSGCVERGNCVLAFDYRSCSGRDIFTSHIDHVDVFVFDNNGEYLRSVRADKSMLAKYRGVTLDLPQGSYNIICWANATSNTNMNIQGNMAHSTAIFAGGDQPSSIDSLCYGRSNNIVVSDHKQAIHNIEFRAAYIRVNVYTKGLTDPDGQGGNCPPIVTFGAVCSGYDFDMNPSTSEISLKKQSVVWNKLEKTTLSRFVVPIFSPVDPIVGSIYLSSDNTLLATLDVRKYMADNAVSFACLNELCIDILIEYLNGDITIQLPGMEQIPIGVS